jgi:tetratricopeptide (TPR) repeat protein
LPVFDQAIALDPSNENVAGALLGKCVANLRLARYDDAIAVCEKGRTLDDHWLFHLDLTAAYAQKGELVKASAAKAELLKRQPDISIARLITPPHSDNPILLEQRSHVLEGLRKAGIPEN